MLPTQNPDQMALFLQGGIDAMWTVEPWVSRLELEAGGKISVLVAGAQSTTHIPINVTALDADFFIFSAHEIFGPTGIGALYGKKHRLDEMPPWQGGRHMIQDVTLGENDLPSGAGEI